MFRLEVLPLHLISIPKLSKEIGRTQGKYNKIPDEDVLVIIEDNGMHDGKNDQNAEDCDVGIVEVDASFKKILRLLVGTEQELFVNVID